MTDDHYQQIRVYIDEAVDCLDADRPDDAIEALARAQELIGRWNQPEEDDGDESI